MKYYFDTEFHEYKKKPLIGEAYDTIELISIGIVSEDIKENIEFNAELDKTNLPIYRKKLGKEYYAICKEFDLKAAWNDEWLRNNVLKPIFWELYNKEFGFSRKFNITNLKYLINKYGKTKKQIAEEIEEYLGVQYIEDKFGSAEKVYPSEKAQFYAYYNSTDWVNFYRIFDTKMLNLPKYIKWVCRELKQMLDEIQEDYAYSLKEHVEYPKQENEHNALDDAKWNKKLYNFIKNL